MTYITIAESASAPVKVGKRWRVTVARPGQGASGFYPESVLRETGPAAFPPGTKSFFNHDAKRDVRDMVGTFPDGAFWNEEEGELQADLEPFPRFRDVLNEAGTAIEASIRSKAAKAADGTVQELVFDRANTVDLVAFAGLEGSGLKYQLESLFSAAAAAEEDGEPAADASAQNTKEGNNMELKEQIEALEAKLSDFMAKFDAFVAESHAEAKGEADAAAVAAAAEARVAEALSAYKEKESAIESAQLLPKQVEVLKERALKGEDIEEALAEAKAFAEEARTVFGSGTRPGVRVVEESGTPNPANITIGRWNK